MLYTLKIPNTHTCRHSSEHTLKPHLNTLPTYWTLVENFIFVSALRSFHCYVLTQTSMYAKS